MSRAVLDLWRAWLPLVLMAFSPVLALLVAPILVPVALGILALGLGACWRNKPLWLRLFARVQRFATLSGVNVRLHYDAALRPQLEAQGVLATCEQGLAALASLLGLSWRGRLVVYLFPSPTDVSPISGRRNRGIFVVEAGVILVALDEMWQLTFRHEAAHLLSLRLGWLGPALKSEGLAVWAAALGEEADLNQWAALTQGPEEIPLSAMVNDSSFRAPARETACYWAAGSFTGYLIRQHGWPAYLQFYRQAGPRTFHPALERAFGTTLAEEEKRWRQGLPAPEAFDPEFFRRYGLDEALAAIANEIAAEAGNEGIGGA